METRIMRTWNKSMLTLGAAVAVGGLVAAVPAQAAMSGAPCGGATATKAGGSMQQGTTGSKPAGNGMTQGTNAKCGGKCAGKSANPCSAKK